MLFDKFPRISYDEAMMKYGSDKPDLRNPLIINDITEIFNGDDVSFEILKVSQRWFISRCIVTKNTKHKPSSFFDGLDKWAKEQGWAGLAYFTLEQDNEIIAKGPVGKFFKNKALEELMKITNAEVGDSIFFACNKKDEIEKITSQAREKIANDLKLIDENICFLLDI